MRLVQRLVGRTASRGFLGRQRLVGIFGNRQPIGEPKASLQTVRQTARNIRAHHDAVDDHINVMLVLLVERRGLGDLVELPVDLDALEALLHQLGEFLLVLALTAADHRREDIKTRAFLQRQDPVDHLAHRLALDRQARGRRIGNANAREQQTHIVVDLGDRSDRRARVARGRLLLDRDRRRQTLDLVDIRLLHHFEELPRIGRQAFHVTPLPFGIDRVEGKRRLAGAGKPRHHDQAVARQIEVNALEIVLARATDGNGLEFAHVRL